jgi:hypothetical protein
MICGAVLCDAGVTALLGSIFAELDDDAAVHNRRVQSLSMYAEHANYDSNLRRKLLEFHMVLACFCSFNGLFYIESYSLHFFMLFLF